MRGPGPIMVCLLLVSSLSGCLAIDDAPDAADDIPADTEGDGRVADDGESEGNTAGNGTEGTAPDVSVVTLIELDTQTGTGIYACVAGVCHGRPFEGTALNIFSFDGQLARLDVNVSWDPATLDPTASSFVVFAMVTTKEGESHQLAYTVGESPQRLQGAVDAAVGVSDEVRIYVYPIADLEMGDTSFFFDPVQIPYRIEGQLWSMTTAQPGS